MTPQKGAYVGVLRVWRAEIVKSDTCTEVGIMTDTADGTHTTPGVPGNDNAVTILFVFLIDK